MSYPLYVYIFMFLYIWAPCIKHTKPHHLYSYRVPFYVYIFTSLELMEAGLSARAVCSFNAHVYLVTLQ